MSIQATPPSPEGPPPPKSLLLDLVDWLDRRSQAYRHESERALRENVGVEIQSAIWSAATRILAVDGKTAPAWFIFFPLATIQTGDGTTIVCRTAGSQDLEAVNNPLSPDVREGLGRLLEDVRRADPSAAFVWKRIDVSPAHLRIDAGARWVTDAMRVATLRIPLGWSGACVVAHLQPQPGFLDVTGKDEKWLRGLVVVASRALSSDERCKALADGLAATYGDLLAKIETAGEMRQLQGPSSDVTGSHSTERGAIEVPARSTHTVVEDLEAEVGRSGGIAERDKKFDPRKGEPVVFQLSLESPGPMGLDKYQVWEVFGAEDSTERIEDFLQRFHRARANGVRSATLVVPRLLPLNWWMHLIRHLTDCKYCRNPNVLTIRSWDDVPDRTRRPGAA